VNHAAGVLRSTFDPLAETISIEVEPTRGTLTEGSRLALTSIVQLTPTDSTTLVRRLASYHELAPASDSVLAGTWRIEAMAISHVPNHAGDGPVSAFLIEPDGSTPHVRVEPMRRLGGTSISTDKRSTDDAVSTGPGALPALLPYPRSMTVTAAAIRHRVADLIGGDEPARAAWDAIVGLERRTRHDTRLGGRDGASVECRVDRSLDTEQYRLAVDRDQVEVVAAGPAGFRHAFVTLAQLLAAGLPERAEIDDRPRWPWRALHVDLARQWFEPELVEGLIDVAAWRKLGQLHLHLTDDEGWRLEIPGYPQLADAARRGHGLTLPPMLGGPPEAVGRAYTAGEIARWVALADQLGVALVPEIDLPAHVHAVLAALPELRDPHDGSGAVSVQYFVDNVLVPGHPATQPFVERVIATVAELFPSSPSIHIGGDEVPDGAWRRSPIVDAFRAAEGATTTADIEAAFHRQLVSLISERHGRRVGAWQEAAESGGVVPGDGYVVGWRTADASRKLASSGYDVVVSPGNAYYLDMAIDDDWDTPGASWAGSTSLADVCAFEPGAGWTADELARLLGVQACIWTEHVGDEATLLSMLLPRLDAIAERAWSGSIAGGCASLRERSQQVRESPR
jgi:hexosaminidase